MWVLPPTGGWWLQAPRFCVWSRTPLAAPSNGAPGVALQRRSWAPTFVWQMGLMTQEDCPWSRLIGLREAQAARPAGSDPGPGRLPGRASWLRLLQIQLNSRRSSGAREIAPIFLEFFIFGFPPSLPASCAAGHVAVGLRFVLASFRIGAFAGLPDQPVVRGGGFRLLLRPRGFA